MHKVLVTAFLLVCALAFAGAAAAQPLGSFRWQQEPYCNVITLSVVQVGGAYQANGFDDECGAAARSAVTGTVFLNPDGTIGMGLTIVPVGGVSFSLEATMTLNTLSGNWRSDSYPSGVWVFTPGPGHPGSPRPAPASTQVVESPGVSIPAVLVAQTQIISLNETVVTPRSGRWSVHKSVSGTSVFCGPGSYAMLFITVDGMPIRNSVVYSAAAYTGVLSGVTMTPIPAGSHVLGIGGQCFSGSPTGTAITVITISSVTVLP